MGIKDNPFLSIIIRLVKPVIVVFYIIYEWPFNGPQFLNFPQSFSQRYHGDPNYQMEGSFKIKLSCTPTTFAHLKLHNYTSYPSMFTLKLIYHGCLLAVFDLFIKYLLWNTYLMKHFNSWWKFHLWIHMKLCRNEYCSFCVVMVNLIYYIITV